ncbi:MAG TPA: molybdate ABC transporter permease subunit, partial [Polyangia bacterium]
MTGRRLTRTRARHLYGAAMVGLGGILLLFLVLPFVALVLDGGPDSIWRGLGCALTWPALRLSLGTSLISVALVVLGGTPLAWWLARSRWRSARWLEILLQLPVVIPPAVGGIALLLAFGRRGLFGDLLERLGWSPAFSSVAVVM